MLRKILIVTLFMVIAITYAYSDNLPPVSIYFEECTEDVENLQYSPGDSFSFNFDMKTTSSGDIADNYCEVLFAKNDKVAGHFEVWLLQGQLAFYAPEMNNNTAIYSGYYVNDGAFHNITITCGNGNLKFYNNGQFISAHKVTGIVSDIPSRLSFRKLNDGTYKYKGDLKNLYMYNHVLTDAQIKDIYEEKTEDRQEENKMLIQLCKEGYNITHSDNRKYLINNFNVNIGNRFSITGILKTSSSDGVSVLFAKGEKQAGHYEVWLNHGELAFYATEMNGNAAVYSGVNVADSKEHHFAVICNGEYLKFYIDGAIKSTAYVTGAVSETSATANIGALIDGTFPYAGYLEDLRIYNFPLSLTELYDMMPESIVPEAFEPDDFHESGNGFKPVKYSPEVPLRGISRLVYPHALPLIDFSATVNYEGSISKTGDNADWDWGMYKDEKGEWVLMEAYGPGCIYNFTQHRYPTSTEPTFRFYIDNGDVPAFEIKQSEFGKKFPFIKPLADIYEGPEDGGRGPIWVVRSFIPMEFNKYCKVTSDIKLEGYDKARGEGGWGHVTYVKYDTYKLYKTDAETDVLKKLAENTTHDPKYYDANEYADVNDLTVKAGETVKIYEKKAEGSIASVKLYLINENVTETVLNDLWIRIYWDGHVKPDVESPIGTFFGNEYNLSGCDNDLMLLGMRLDPGKYLKCYNYFPMPFWESARIELYNRSSQDIKVYKAEIGFTPDKVCKYEKGRTGYFVSSAYYTKTANIGGKNSIIANVQGSGHMVYGVVSGYGIMSGCEGDVRVFIDGRNSPEIESDGSESWASYGWGFVTPPQSNPFSGYNGAYNSNSYWSECRITAGDSYFFKTSIRFELEHGGANDGFGSHSGQIFMYMLPDTAETYKITDRIDVSDKASLDEHKYTVSGSYESKDIKSAYENGIHSNYEEGSVHTGFDGSISFIINIDRDNKGIVLNRKSSQQTGRQCALIYVDDVLVSEAMWYFADSNPYYMWLDDSFQIPAKYTKGKEKVKITVEPVAQDGVKTWNHSQYTVISLLYGENESVSHKTSGMGLVKYLALGLVLITGVTGIIYYRKKVKKQHDKH